LASIRATPLSEDERKGKSHRECITTRGIRQIARDAGSTVWGQDMR
jgi:hypothetical protein